MKIEMSEAIEIITKPEGREVNRILKALCLVTERLMTESLLASSPEKACLPENESGAV